MAVNSKASEIWKDIVGYEGLYQISSKGNIVSKNGKVKSQAIDHGGYCTVWLSKNSVQKCLKVHRLVAQSFIENPENKKTVNHIDGVKTNNCVENLEWATHSENIIHANNTGLRKVTDAQRKAASENGKKTCDKNRIRKAVYFEANGVRIEFVSAHEAARYIGGVASGIIGCCKGRLKKYKGFEWRYCNDN